MHAHKDTIMAMIASLQNTRRNLVLRLASEEASCDERFKEVIVQEVENIEEEIKEQSGKLQSIDRTPQKSSHSPNL